MSMVVAKALRLTIGLVAPIGYLAQGRGVPWMLGDFVLPLEGIECAFTRTKWGCSVFGVGGTREAARRANIDVCRIYTVLRALLDHCSPGRPPVGRAALPFLSAGWLRRLNLNAMAASVIGGTSLVGGRGSAYSALLGILIVQAISSSPTPFNLSWSLRYMILGGVLALAVIVDSVARKSRAPPWAARPSGSRRSLPGWAKA